MLLIFMYLLTVTGAIANQETEIEAERPSTPVAYRAPLAEAERIALRKQGFAEPIGNPGEWVATDDYPESALSAERTGITGFRVQVDTAGQVSNCEIAESSGHNDLDSATCALVSERARFKPALDQGGKAVSGTYTNRVRWQVPKIPIPLPTSGSHTFVFTIETDGTVSDCKQTGSHLSDLDLCASTPTYTVPVDKSGKAVRKKVIYTSTTHVSDTSDAE